MLRGMPAFQQALLCHSESLYCAWAGALAEQQPQRSLLAAELLLPPPLRACQPGEGAAWPWGHLGGSWCWALLLLAARLPVWMLVLMRWLTEPAAVLLPAVRRLMQQQLL